MIRSWYTFEELAKQGSCSFASLHSSVSETLDSFLLCCWQRGTFLCTIVIFERKFIEKGVEQKLYIAKFYYFSLDENG